MEVSFAFLLAAVTLASFLLGGAYERWHTRKAWVRAEKSSMGRAEEDRRVREGRSTHEPLERR